MIQIKLLLPSSVIVSSYHCILLFSFLFFFICVEYQERKWIARIEEKKYLNKEKKRES